MIRVGSGHDTHQLAEGRPLILGGVVIPHARGLVGHSDADVVLHAITDALLGPSPWATLVTATLIPTRDGKGRIRSYFWPKHWNR